MDNQTRAEPARSGQISWSPADIEAATILAETALQSKAFQAWKEQRAFQIQGAKKLKKQTDHSQLSFLADQLLRVSMWQTQQTKLIGSPDSISVKAEVIALLNTRSPASIEAALTLLQFSKRSELLEDTVGSLMAAGLRIVPWVTSKQVWAVPRNNLLLNCRMEFVKSNPRLLPLPLCHQPDVSFEPPGDPPAPRFVKPRPQGSFSILNCIMSNPEVLYNFVKHLPHGSLISLYAISKSFHYLFNMHYLTYVTANARFWVGSSALKAMPWTAFSALTIIDPIKRDLETENKATMSWSAGNWKNAIRLHSREGARIINLLQDQENDGLVDNQTIGGLVNTLKRGPNEPGQSTFSAPMNDYLSKARILPSLKYLSMLNSRFEDARTIGRCLFFAGHVVWPQGLIVALLKLSLLMKIRNNANRIGLVHNENYFTSQTILTLLTAFIKIDMLLSDSGPDNNDHLFTSRLRNRGRALRSVLFRQESLRALADFLITTTSLDQAHRPFANQLDLWQLYVTSAENTRTSQPMNQTFLGLPSLVCGSIARENHDSTRSQLLGVDRIVALESVRRGGTMGLVHTRALILGYVDNTDLAQYMHLNRNRFEVPRPNGNGSLVIYGPMTMAQARQAYLRNNKQQETRNKPSSVT